MNSSRPGIHYGAVEGLERSGALASLFETYWKLIYNAQSKGRSFDSAAQDVVQETVISVMKTMRRFDYDR